MLSNGVLENVCSILLDLPCIVITLVRSLIINPGHARMSRELQRLVLGCGSLGEVGFIPELNPLFALLFRLAAICDPTYVTLHNTGTVHCMLWAKGYL